MPNQDPFPQQVGPISQDADDEAGFQESSRRLICSVARQRRRAARELWEHGFRSVPVLSRALWDPELSVREAAAEALGRIGTPEAVDALCDALWSSDLPTRAAVACALGETGDERSIPPLVEALRACFTRGSAKVQRRIGLAVHPLLFGCTILLLLSEGSARQKSVLFLCYAAIALWSFFSQKRRSHSKVCAAISNALARIAAAHPNADLHRLAPELRAVSGDFLLQERAARIAARKAAAGIEALTANHRELPLAAAPPALDGSSLPRVSQPTSEPNSQLICETT